MLKEIKKILYYAIIISIVVLSFSFIENSIKAYNFYFEEVPGVSDESIVAQSQNNKAKLSEYKSNLSKLNDDIVDKNACLNEIEKVIDYSDKVYFKDFNTKKEEIETIEKFELPSNLNIFSIYSNCKHEEEKLDHDMVMYYSIDIFLYDNDYYSSCLKSLDFFSNISSDTFLIDYSKPKSGIFFHDSFKKRTMTIVINEYVKMVLDYIGEKDV